MANLETQPEPSAPPTRPVEPPVWPYIVPLAGFLAFTTLESYLPNAPGGAPSPFWYPVGYALKVAGVAVLIWVCRVTLHDLRPMPTVLRLLVSVAVGLAVAAAWVLLDGHYPRFGFMGGKRMAFDPTVLSPALRAAFIAIRMFGLVLLVPIVEELFYRSFLMRWLIDPIYTRVPIGTVTPLSLAVTSLVFASSHPEWLPALLTGLAWGWLVHWTKSVRACVVSHAVANLALGVYVIAFHAWEFW